MGRLDVKILGCKNLPDTQLLSKIDPYCIVECENKKYQTKVAENTENPKWDELFKFTVSDPDSVRLSFKIWNSNLVSDEFLGQYEMAISGLTKGQPYTSWHLLQQCKSNAEIGIELFAHDFGKEPEVQQQQQQQVPASPPMQQQQQPPPGMWVPQGNHTGFQIQQGLGYGGGFIGGGGGGYHPQQPPQIPMPQGPSAFGGFVPPVMPQFMNTNGAQGQLTHCRNGHMMSNTAPYDDNRMQLWCDLCFHKCVGGTGAKQCRQCDLDICQRCQQVYSRLPPKPLCPQGHPLDPRPEAHGWRCDKCRQGGEKGSMRCKRCDFDVCDKCFVPYVAAQWQHAK